VVVVVVVVLVVVVIVVVVVVLVVVVAVVLAAAVVVVVIVVVVVVVAGCDGDACVAVASVRPLDICRACETAEIDRFRSDFISHMNRAKKFFCLVPELEFFLHL
jgi:hypothetical protein